MHYDSEQKKSFRNILIVWDRGRRSWYICGRDLKKEIEILGGVYMISVGQDEVSTS